MYQTYVPLMNYSVTPQTRKTYLKQFKEAKVNKIFLSVFGYGDDPATDFVMAAALRENIDFFRREGIEAGVWIGRTIGHGGELSFGADYLPDLSSYTKMMGLSGQEAKGVCCPYDENFRKRIAAYVSAIATSGAKIVLLDDDFRISHGSKEYYCACDLHMAKIRELCGENISREELRELAFSQKANKYRAAWLKAQGESLELLAADIRAAVDRVAPDVRVGLCSSPDLVGVDGTDPVKLAGLLAGECTKPFFRMSGAPYWAVVGKKRPLATIIEMTRLQAYLSRERGGAEMISEGDTYPRPRYNVPASLLEMFDAALRIDGQFDGILKYMVDYNGSPEFETSYLCRHTKNLAVMERLDEMFGGKQMLGVNVSTRKDLLADADLEMGAMPRHLYYSMAGAMMALNSVPSMYGAGGICRAIFGEEARHVDLAELEKGAILDGIAAQILTDRGVDVGLAARLTFKEDNVLYLTDAEERERAFATPSGVRYAPMKLSQDAKVVCKMEFKEGTEPFAYTYESASGARFLVYSFDGTALPRDTGMFRGYLQQQVLKNGIEWISGKRLPAFISHCPGLYMMCKGDGKKMAVALFNFFADSVDEPVIRLDRAYANIRFLGCSGKLEGDTVVLDAPIYAYTFAAFEVW